jgi:hypothetical protein
MGNIICMVMMCLQMWIKFNQYYHVYHMMIQQCKVCLKRCFEYKVPHILRNVFSNMINYFYVGLIKTPLYKDLNATIHHQWTSLFLISIS